MSKPRSATTMAALAGVFLVAALLLMTCGTPAKALPNDARVPVLLYHTRHVEPPCTYGSNDLLALEQDLETLHQEGYTVVPVYWLVQWALGWRDGSTLPEKAVGLTFDDGYDSDFLDRAPNDHECAPLKSAYTVLREFRDRYADELPEHSPHAATFVIASREVRQLLEEDHFQHNWWAAAHYSGLMEVYSHGSDHDHPVVQEPIWDELLGEHLPASGHADGHWKGVLRPDRINDLASSRVHISVAAEYIASRIGVWPDLFAHPMGLVSEYTRTVYLPQYFHEHGTVAAFCTEVAGRGPHPRNYLTRGADRWCLPRLTHGYSWRTPEKFLAVLRGSGQ